MMTRIVEQVRKLGRPRILVVGDLLLDRYVWGRVDRISPEAPIQILRVESEEIRLGGAANVARNLRSLGARVTLAGVVGADANGAGFSKLARAAGISTAGVVRDPARPTSTKTRMMARNHQMLRVDREDPEPVSGASLRDLLARVAPLVRRSELVVISDYHKGTLVPEIARALVRGARRAGVPALVGLKSLDHLKYRHATGAALNRTELRALSGRDGLDAGARALQSRLGLRFLVVTLGEEGLAVYARGARPFRLPTQARQVFDVTGAGDTALAALGLALACGWSLPDCARLANAAAGVVVGKVGTSWATRQEIVQQLTAGGAGADSKVFGQEDLARVLERERRRGRRVVFTNGCFDLLHLGHVKLLQLAKAQGDLLVVGLNSDRSVRRTKGNRRPILGERERAQVLGAIEACDYVVIFDEPTPDRIIRRLKPDILVKGEDWLRRGVVGSRQVRRRGGRIVLAPILRGHSSSGIIDRILQRYADGRAANGLRIRRR